jgi:hypothetical protein
MLFLPNCRLGPSKLVELGGAQRCLCDREELVELRRRYGSAAEHCVRVAAMMHLVLEKVQQKAVGPLRLHARAAVHTDDPIWPGFVQRLAPGDQATIDRRLGRPQVRDGVKGNWIRPRGRAERATLQRIDVEPVVIRMWFKVAWIDGKKPVRGASNSACVNPAQAASKRWFAQALLYAIARKV